VFAIKLRYQYQLQMRTTSYVTFLLLFFIHSVSAQNFVYPGIKIKSTAFTGGNLIIQKDDGTGSYSSPQWASQPLQSNPVAYVSGSPPTVTASFSFECNNAPSFVLVRGKASDSIDFAAIKINLVLSSGNLYSLTYPETKGSHVFKAGMVRYFSPFVINWEVSFDDGISWNAIGETKNTLYVTGKAPQAETTQFKWFHTVFDLSCKNADKLSDEKLIIAGIWNEFTDQIILNYKGDSLFYYKKLGITNQTLGALLKYRDAQCYTFAQLFLASIKIQGIIRSNNYVYIAGKSKTVCGNNIDRFLVKNWSFGNPTGGNFCSSLPYKMVYDQQNLKTSTTYKFISTDIKDQLGTPGSCTKNPASFFANHQVALIDGVYYDASYGLAFTSLKELKEKEIAAWGFGTYQGTQVTCYFTNDLSATEMGESITTY
jgi:hypothetical protein